MCARCITFVCYELGDKANHLSAYLRRSERAIEEVLAGQPYANDVFSNRQLIEFEGKLFELYRVEDENQQLINWVIRGEQEGYSGTIRFLIGLKISGEIIGVRIISHSETPGLGDKIEAEKSSWILSFAKRTLESTGVWAVKKDGVILTNLAAQQLHREP